MSVENRVKDNKEYITRLRRHFHQNPELSMKEFETAKIIEAELDALHIPHKRVGGTGVIGFIGDPTAEKKVLLRADIDALPITDCKTTSYKSKNDGIMHACGHDGHTASLLGAAKILKELEPEINGCILLAFQPGEEIGAGARIFVEEGWLKNVGRVFGIHFDSSLPTGKVSIKNGECNASCDYFKINVAGRSAHVSTPHLGSDALYIASQIVVNLQAITSRLNNPLDTIVVGVGTLKAGTSYNIVANNAVLEGTTRCFSAETRSKVNNKVKEIAVQTAKLYGGTAEVEFVNYANPLVNHTVACDEAEIVLTPIIGKENIVLDSPKRLGADDFADFLDKAPGVYAFVGSANPLNSNTSRPHHHELFDIDEGALLIATNIYVRYATEFLNENIIKKQ